MVKHTQTIRRLLPTNSLSMFDYFVGLTLKGIHFTRFVALQKTHKAWWVTNQNIFANESNTKKLETLGIQDILNIDSIKVNIFVFASKHDNLFATQSEVEMKNQVFMISIKHPATSPMSVDKTRKL